MTYSVEAKELYDTFHDAMGDWGCPHFERITAREIEAWQKVAYRIERLEDRIRDAREEVRQIDFELRDALDKQAEAEADLDEACRRIQRLEQFKVGVHFNIGECK